MQKIFSLGAYAPIRYIVLALLVLPGCQIIYAQDPKRVFLYLDTIPVKTVSWNILFKQNTKPATRDLTIKKIKIFLKTYYQHHHHDTIPVFDSPVYCPCDSLLYNLNMKFIDGSGGSVSSPPPPRPQEGSGDCFAVQYIRNNTQVLQMEPDVKQVKFKNALVPLDSFLIDDHTVLAIIDTGIDTTKFSSNVQELLWRKPMWGKTMYNFLPHQNLYDLRDDHRLKHGTVVTALALKALSTGAGTTIYPKIMILKALNAKKRGSVFSVSCALSYAYKNKATVVNASLGYYGSGDSVLLHYIKQCNSDTNKPILIFAAAGNLRGDRTVDLCHPPRTDSQLTASRTFFPACWSSQLNHVITITGLNLLGKSCYYQNYSGTYVSLGVLNTRSSEGKIQGGCCSYKVPFIENVYEGSSFATPVACGLLMRYMLNNNISTLKLIRVLAAPGNDPTGNIIHQGSPRVTRDGKYLVFPVNPPQ